MRAVILVGGEGTRLRPLTCNIPKPMVPVANRPFLEHMLNHLKRHGIDDVVLAVCYLPDHISSYFGDGSALGMRLAYIVEEAPLGTAGAVRNVHEREPFGSTFLVFNGDVYTDLDLTAMIESHRELRATASIALTPVEDPTVYGIVETAHDNRVRRFLEKPSWDAVTTNMINAGTYVLEPEVLSHMSPGYCTFERDVFPGLLSAAYPLYGFPSRGYWLDIGTPEKYLQLHHDILMGKVPGNLPGERLIEGVWVEEGCDMRPTARVTGPVLMGRNCFLGDHVHVNGPLVMGESSLTFKCPLYAGTSGSCSAYPNNRRLLINSATWGGTICSQPLSPWRILSSTSREKMGKAPGSNPCRPWMKWFSSRYAYRWRRWGATTRFSAVIKAPVAGSR